MALVGGANFNEALSAGWDGFQTGVIIGGVAGAGSAYAYSKANNINPFNGKSLGFKGDESNYKYAKRLQKNNSDFFENRNYNDKVNLDMLKGDNHSFPESVKGFQGDGVIKFIKGNDGYIRPMLEIRGIYNGKDGYFQFMDYNPYEINHRYFYTR